MPPLLGRGRDDALNNCVLIHGYVQWLFLMLRTCEQRSRAEPVHSNSNSRSRRRTCDGFASFFLFVATNFCEGFQRYTIRLSEPLLSFSTDRGLLRNQQQPQWGSFRHGFVSNCTNAAPLHLKANRLPVRPALIFYCREKKITPVVLTRRMLETLKLGGA